MKKIVLFLSVLLIVASLSSCLNDEKCDRLRGFEGKLVRSKVDSKLKGVVVSVSCADPGYLTIKYKDEDDDYAEKQFKGSEFELDLEGGEVEIEEEKEKDWDEKEAVEEEEEDNDEENETNKEEDW